MIIDSGGGGLYNTQRTYRGLWREGKEGVQDIRVETPEGAYEVRIASGCLEELGRRARDVLRARQVCVVSDSRVAALYLERALASLEEAGFVPRSFLISPGEASKNGENFLILLGQMARWGFTRTDALVALGGGVVGDLAGFAAASYMRGIDLIQLPTTLLSCVDSAVGGKTAINLPEGKNLCGAFHQPVLVLCDPELLDSLPDEILREGCAEVIKYGMLGSTELLEGLGLRPIRGWLPEIIARCVGMKRDIVSRDLRDKGCRQLLNLGHSFGHAMEMLSGYTLSHGRAVAMGLALITRASVNLGLCSREVLAILLELLKGYGLPAESGYGAAELARAALRDKKMDGDALQLVVPRGLGSAELLRVPAEELITWARAGTEP